MKKYIAPSLKVVNIQNESILAGSLTVDTNILTDQQYARGRRAHFYEEEEVVEEIEW